MQNLYDILGVTRGATNRDINAALRQLVRRYNEETAQGTRDSAEALKIINRARITFADPERRARYDAELIALEARLAQSTVSPKTQELNRTPAPTPSPPDVAPAPAPVPEPKDNEAAPAVAPDVAPAPAFVPEPKDAEVAPAVAPAKPPPATSPRQQPPPAMPRVQGPPTSLGLPPLDEPLPVTLGRTSALALDSEPAIITRGARDAAPMTLDPVVLPTALAGGFETRAPFVVAAPGSATEGFDLRPVLTTRGAARQRSTLPHPLSRLAARLIDYGLWGIILAFVLRHLVAIGAVSAEHAGILSNPLVAPIAITFSWAWVEAILLIFFPITPGKFLLNIRVAFNVSNPYATSDPGALVSSSFGRAFRVWWRGAALGLTPIYLLSMLRAWRKLVSFKETTWDFDGDCLVTHGRVMLPVTALATALVAGGGWLYATQWADPLWRTLDTGWRYATTAATGAQEMYKALAGDMPTYRKNELPAPPPRENRSVTMEQEAKELLAQRQWFDLAEHCRAWTREEERSAAAWFCYGKARHELHDYGGATTALKRAAVLDPQNDDIRLLLQKSSLADMQERQMRKRAGPELPRPENVQAQ